MLRKIGRKRLMIVKPEILIFLLFAVKIKKMGDVNAVCRQFKLLRENCHLSIEYSLIECCKHSMEK